MVQNRHTWQTPAFPQSYNFCQQDTNWSVLSWKKDLMSLWKLMHTWIPQKFPSLREVKGQPCKRGQSWSAAGSLPLLRAKVHHSCSQLLPLIMVTKLAKDAWLSKKLTSLVCYKPILRKAVIIPEGPKNGWSIFHWTRVRPLATLVTNWLTD